MNSLLHHYQNDSSMAGSRRLRTKAAKLKRFLVSSLISLALLLIGFGAGYFFQEISEGERGFLSPLLINHSPEPPRPLQRYAFRSLAKEEIKPSEIIIDELISETASYHSYLFFYQSQSGRISGQVNFPRGLDDSTQSPPVIVMLRGFHPLSTYSTGGGTRNAAAAYAASGFITIAPDFLGYGQSDPELTDNWEARLAKPVQVIELIETVRQVGIPDPNTLAVTNPNHFQTDQIGLWGHSNGGQIAISVLQILGEPLPTTLWAPVTSPFPYSTLFFSLESSDEGKSHRRSLAAFERLYDVFDFTITKNLDLQTGPVLLHHGRGDNIAPIAWSESFVNLVNQENERRRDPSPQELSATESEVGVGDVAEPLPPIELTFIPYPSADHNMQPDWQAVVNRDISFFTEQLKN